MDCTPSALASTATGGGPARPEVGETRPTPSAADRLVSPRSTVIVADDDADMRAYIRRAIREQATVHEAADGAEALRLARALRPHLVIADVRMPGLDGHALGAALQADPLTAAIPVLLVSGEPPGVETGSAGFLAKPFNAASLRAAVARWIR